ncbi:MAG: rRNA (uracil-5-)-methyltransferase RumA [Candidatus Solibacter sp.]|jgi:23S rRNA (uracil1939-C5)-methyltransferase|nr:rRNA (uracil-5-)-methyltransferase RumA [Candidatus Solibacter sp.]
MVEGTGVTLIVSNFEVTVEKLVYGGDGLGRVDGRVIFAPFVLPGERIRAQAEKEKPGMVRARMLEVLEAAPDRIAALCPYFGKCGGCHYQHAPYAYQLAAKRAILAEELRRLGKMEPPDEIGIVSAEPFGYRNRVQLHVEDARIGYREARSHKLCAVSRCPVGSPKVEAAIAALNEMARDGRWPRFMKSIEIFTDETQVQLNVLETERPVARRFFDWCGEKIPGMVEGALDYEGRFRVSSNSFFQVNRFLIDRLVEVALEGAEGETALDLYAGVGLLSVPLARKFREVTAVESGAGAVRDLQFNADRAGLTNLKALPKTAEEYLAGLETAPDLVVLDPPRTGLGKAVVKRLGELKPRQVTIVACDPATLARDLAGLVAAGYAIEKMTLVDLFPQTYHLETVVRLRLSN